MNDTKRDPLRQEALGLLPQAYLLAHEEHEEVAGSRAREMHRAFCFGSLDGAQGALPSACPRPVERIFVTELPLAFATSPSAFGRGLGTFVAEDMVRYDGPGVDAQMVPLVRGLAASTIPGEDVAEQGGELG